MEADFTVGIYSRNRISIKRLRKKADHAEGVPLSNLFVKKPKNTVGSPNAGEENMAKMVSTTSNTSFNLLMISSLLC